MSLIATNQSPYKTGLLNTVDSVPANSSKITDIHNNPQNLAARLKRDKDCSFNYIRFHIKTSMKSMGVKQVTIRYNASPITIELLDNGDMSYYLNRSRISSDTFQTLLKKG